jgi:molybdenum cofactor biosynthesis protein MoaF
MSASDPIRGRTLRWTFSDGPTAETTFEHDFRTDGTVVFRGAGSPKDTAMQVPVRYGTARVTDDGHVVSYLSPGGYALTVVLDFENKRMVGFASNEKEWFQQQGTFEVVS